MELLGVEHYLSAYEVIPLEDLLKEVILLMFRLKEDGLERVVIEVKAIHGRISAGESTHNSTSAPKYLWKFDYELLKWIFLKLPSVFINLASASYVSFLEKHSIAS